MTQMRRLQQGVVTIFFVGVVFSLSLEVAFRLGIPSSSRFRLEQKILDDKDKFRVVLLGDSFSVDFDGKEQQYYASKGIGFLNLSLFGTVPIDNLTSQVAIP